MSRKATNVPEELSSKFTAARDLIWACSQDAIPSSVHFIGAHRASTVIRKTDEAIVAFIECATRLGTDLPARYRRPLELATRVHEGMQEYYKTRGRLRYRLWRAKNGPTESINQHKLVLEHEKMRDLFHQLLLKTRGYG